MPERTMDDLERDILTTERRQLLREKDIHEILGLMNWAINGLQQDVAAGRATLGRQREEITNLRRRVASLEAEKKGRASRAGTIPPPAPTVATRVSGAGEAQSLLGARVKREHTDDGTTGHEAKRPR